MLWVTHPGSLRHKIFKHLSFSIWYYTGLFLNWIFAADIRKSDQNINWQTNPDLILLTNIWVRPNILHSDVGFIVDGCDVVSNFGIFKAIIFSHVRKQDYIVCVQGYVSGFTIGRGRGLIVKQRVEIMCDANVENKCYTFVQIWRLGDCQFLGWGQGADPE